MKTLQECKGEVMRKYDFIESQWSAVFCQEYADEAAELYARAKWDQACDNSLKEFERLKDKASTVRDAIYLDGVMAVIDSVKKEFKP